MRKNKEGREEKKNTRNYSGFPSNFRVHPLLPHHVKEFTMIELLLQETLTQGPLTIFLYIKIAPYYLLQQLPPTNDEKRFKKVIKNNNVRLLF